MIEHEHFVDKRGQADVEITRDSGQSFISLPASVLISAVLVCLSIFYNTNLLIRNLGGGAVVNQQAAANTAPSLVQNQPTPTQAPIGPVTVTARNDEPVLGNSNAKVTMVEFGDFQCPFCQSFTQQTFPQIKSQYVDTGKVKFIFRHFPLPFHINAQISAVAAECANRQGKFWPYHDLLYKNGQADGTNLDKASLEKYAGTLGLNSGTLGFGSNKFNQCLEQNATLDVVKNDNAEGTKDGVSGTPTFFINGKLLVGAQPFAQFQQALDAALK